MNIDFMRIAGEPGMTADVSIARMRQDDLVRIEIYPADGKTIRLFLSRDRALRIAAKLIETVAVPLADPA